MESNARRGGAKRPTLLLVGDTVDDRRVIASVVDEHDGAIVAVTIPTPGGRSPARVKIGQQMLVLAVARDHRTVVPLRFATAASIEAGAATTTILLELAGRPTSAEPGLVQAFVEARMIWPDRGRLHLDGPPLGSADSHEDAWRTAVQRLIDIDADAFADTAFVSLDDVRPNVLHIIAPGVEESHLHALALTLMDRDGSVLAELPGAAEVELPDSAAARVEIRHRSVNGGLSLGAATVSRAELPRPVPAVGSSSGELATPTGPSDDGSRSGFAAYAMLQLIEGKTAITPSLVADIAARLLPAAPHDTRIVVRQAKALLEDGRVEQAIEALRSISDIRRSGDGEALLLVAELSAGVYEVPLDRYGRATFDDWSFERLTATVAKLPPAAAASVTEALMMVLSETRAATLVARVGEKLAPGPSLVGIATRIAAVDPNSALDLLSRAGELGSLPSELVERLYRLQLASDQADVADCALELTRRHCANGRLAEAAVIADEVRHRLHWRDAQAVADTLLDALVKGPPDWSDDRLLQAYSTVALMQDAIRGLKDVDLSEGIEVAARLRQALEPMPAEVGNILAIAEAELFTALEATEAHRAALEELGQASLTDLRDRLNGKRVFVVGGRRPDWWDAVITDLALDKGSNWREVEPGRRPSMEWLKAKVGGGRIDLLIVITDYIAHATSAITEYAEERRLTVIKARTGRYSLLSALRSVGTAA